MLVSSFKAMGQAIKFVESNQHIIISLFFIDIKSIELQDLSLLGKYLPTHKQTNKQSRTSITEITCCIASYYSCHSSKLIYSYL